MRIAEASPWSLFLPVALAVMAGSLAADGVRQALVTVFGRPAPASAEAFEGSLPRIVAMPAEAVADTDTGVASGPTAMAAQADGAPGTGRDAGRGGTDGAKSTPVPPIDDAAGAASGGSDSQAARTGDAAIPDLPGPLSAMRDASARACINGTIAERRPNGWEQAFVDDRPVRCTAANH